MAKRNASAEGIFVIVLLLGAIGIGTYQVFQPKKYSFSYDAPDGVFQVNSTGDLRKFSSVSEMRSFLGRNSQAAGSGISSMLSFAGGGRESLVSSKVAAAAPSADGSEASFSGTNVQVSGVDEGDYVKTDGNFIYVISGRKLSIIDASSLETISSLSIGDSSSWESPRPVELFVSKDKLLLFSEENERKYYFSMYDITPYPAYTTFTRATIYDISDKSSPREISSSRVSGYYSQGRLIDEMAYVVTTESASNNYPGPIVYKETGDRLMPEIYYFDKDEESYQASTVTSISLSSDSLVESDTFLLGYSNALMVSRNAIYIATEKARPFFRCFGCFGYSDQRERFYSVVLPLLPADLKAKIEEISSGSGSEEEKWDKISIALSEFFGEMGTEAEVSQKYEQTFGEIRKALEEYDAKEQLKYQETIIHKISIDNGKVEYSSKGAVTGKLLNQFSMDEGEDGRLRVATTVDYWAGSSVRYSNVFVLNPESLSIEGKLENISAGERIYSARFLGNRLYLVTFLQTDPFFVIDLSNPSSPAILGELKLPGFSNYLHPYDENTIIGIGKETEETEEGRGVQTKGVKIALFDVSDVSSPSLLSKFEIGLAGSDSSALHDHKAFLFAKEKALLVLPVTEVVEKIKEGPYDYMYSYRIWDGAYAFSLSREAGIVPIGKVEHESSSAPYYYWGSSAPVRRSLYINDTLYTFSEGLLKASRISANLTTIGSVKLPSFEYGGKPYPVDDVVEPMVAGTSEQTLVKSKSVGME